MQPVGPACRPRCAAHRRRPDAPRPSAHGRRFDLARATCAAADPAWCHGAKIENRASGHFWAKADTTFCRINKPCSIFGEPTGGRSEWSRPLVCIAALDRRGRRAALFDGKRASGVGEHSGVKLGPCSQHVRIYALADGNLKIKVSLPGRIRSSRAARGLGRRLKGCADVSPIG
jgi:hypothetical protein